jgi:nucleotidyltransferase/DNA polymerase involved in DNA repair
MERVILHSDINNFYASVECLYNPSLRDKPLAVGSKGDSKFGVILAKNYLAKKYKVETGDAIWQAKRKCNFLMCIERVSDEFPFTRITFQMMDFGKFLKNKNYFLIMRNEYSLYFSILIICFILSSTNIRLLFCSFFKIKKETS